MQPHSNDYERFLLEELQKVLKAKDGSTPHTQTVARVMKFLEELGGEEVTLVKRRGTKRIAFSAEAVFRLRENAVEVGRRGGSWYAMLFRKIVPSSHAALPPLV